MKNIFSFKLWGKKSITNLSIESTSACIPKNKSRSCPDDYPLTCESSGYCCPKDYPWFCFADEKCYNSEETVSAKCQGTFIKCTAKK